MTQPNSDVPALPQRSAASNGIRQSSDGLWYPGPPSKPDGMTLKPLSKDANKDKDRDVDAAIWLTLRVLVVLRRIN